MSYNGYTLKDLINGFGFKTEQELNNYLRYGNMQPGEN